MPFEKLNLISRMGVASFTLRNRAVPHSLSSYSTILASIDQRGSSPIMWLWLLLLSNGFLSTATPRLFTAAVEGSEPYAGKKFWLLGGDVSDSRFNDELAPSCEWLLLFPMAGRRVCGGLGPMGCLLRVVAG